MKNKSGFLLMVFVALCTSAFAQTVSTRTSNFEVDFSDPKKLVNSTVPVINWITPIAETSYSQESRFKIKLNVDAITSLKSVTIYVRENEESAARGTLPIMPEEDGKLHMEIDKMLTLMDGENLIEIVAENTDGVKTFSQKKITVGTTSLADASKLNRTDYALVFATDKYDNWSGLVNPIFDSRTIADELRKTYGFKVEMVENASQSEMLKKIREYGEKKYQPLDQLFIFFAGHGTYDQTFGEGFVVTRESLLNDEAKTTYLSHNRLRSIANNIPCEHIFLAMDVCFGGTFDQALASSRGAEEEVYKEQNQSEFITRKLTYKTRKFLTSGGKQYVSDGIPGKHSPFAKSFIDALRSRGGRDGILTLPEIFTYVEKLKIQPRFGEFGDNAPGSDFIFVAR
jgi:Caspase domain